MPPRRRACRVDTETAHDDEPHTLPEELPPEAPQERERAAEEPSTAQVACIPAKHITLGMGIVSKLRADRWQGVFRMGANSNGWWAQQKAAESEAQQVG